MGKGISNPHAPLRRANGQIHFMHAERHKRKLQMRSALNLDRECLSCFAGYLAKFQQHHCQLKKTVNNIAVLFLLQHFESVVGGRQAQLF
jgi:hypothetical protein